MPYTNCAICGAKALVGATRCPRCEAPFVSYAVQGKRVPTVNCPQCGVQRPVAIGVCPNCFASATHSARRVSRGLLVAGLAIAGIMSIGYLASRTVPPATVAVEPPGPGAPDSTAGTDSLTVAVVRPATTESVAVTVKPNALPVPVPQPIPAATDTGVWMNAVATTWVNMRSAPNIESTALRVIDSAQRVQLGESVQGWRPVRFGSDRGWVDSRYFAPVRAARAARP